MLVIAMTISGHLEVSFTSDSPPLYETARFYCFVYSVIKKAYKAKDESYCSHKNYKNSETKYARNDIRSPWQ